MKNKLWLILSAIGGLFYRAGGTSAGTLWRDLGVPLVTFIILLTHWMPLTLFGWLMLIVAFGLMFVSLTTYRYFFPKPKDYSWWHYAMHGFFVAFAMIPYAYVTGHWVGFGLRCLVCSLAMGLWYFIAKWNDILHEVGRGIIICTTIPILLL